jgi:hypothetical protein
MRWAPVGCFRFLLVDTTADLSLPVSYPAPLSSQGGSETGSKSLNIHCDRDCIRHRQEQYTDVVAEIDANTALPLATVAL